MNQTTRTKVKTIEDKLEPKCVPFRAAVQFSKRIDDPPTRENTYYGENMEARNLRYKARVDRGFITMAEYEELASQPVTSGLEQFPDIDYPLIEV